MSLTSKKDEANKPNTCCSNTANTTNKSQSGCCAPRQKNEACCDKTLTKNENRTLHGCC